MSTVEKPTDGVQGPAAADNCVEILLERLPSRPGVLAIEASFREGTLRIRYQPTRISLEELNALGDEVGVLISQRLQGCDRHGDQSACRECTVQLAESRPGLTRDFDASTAHGRVSLSRRVLPAESAEVVRPLVPTKPWGASLSNAEEAHYAKNRAMATLTGLCLGLLIAGMALDRLQAAPALVQAAFLAPGAAGAARAQ